MIRLEGITKSFGSLQVLRGIDLEIKKGEVVSIVGPSGAGKTTLLQIMGTLDMPDSGSVTIDGTLVNCLKEKELSAFRNKHIGFVFQFHQLLPEFTALENVMIPAFIAGVGQQEARAAAAEILDFMGWRNALRTSPMSCPVERSKGLPLPVRSSIILRWCWRMSRPEVWIRIIRKNCTNCSSICVTVWARHL